MTYREFFRDYVKHLSDEDWKAIGTSVAFYKKIIETARFIYQNEYLHRVGIVELLTDLEF